MTRRDRTLPFGLAGLTLALACLTLVGLPADVLLAAPVLFTALPLLLGRYLGEEHLARLAAAYVVRRRRPTASLAPSTRRCPRLLPRGGRLIATSLAERPPPRAPLTA